MNHKISEFVYAILERGEVIIATLDIREHQISRHTMVTQLVSGHNYPAAMVFPATYENYEALQILYGDIEVPPIPMEPNELVHALLKTQEFVIVKRSNYSYKDARCSGHEQVRTIWACSHTKSGLSEAIPYMVPYDIHGNEITELPDET